MSVYSDDLYGHNKTWREGYMRGKADAEATLRSVEELFDRLTIEQKASITAMGMGYFTAQDPNLGSIPVVNITIGEVLKATKLRGEA